MRSFAARFPRYASPWQAMPVLALLGTSAMAAGPAHRYTLDPAGSQVSARVGFFGIASKTAQFPEVSGGVALDPAGPMRSTLMSHSTPAPSGQATR